MCNCESIGILFYIASYISRHNIRWSYDYNIKSTMISSWSVKVPQLYLKITRSDNLIYLCMLKSIVKVMSMKYE